MVCTLAWWATRMTLALNQDKGPITQNVHLLQRINQFWSISFFWQWGIWGLSYSSSLFFHVYHQHVVLSFSVHLGYTQWTMPTPAAYPHVSGSMSEALKPLWWSKCVSPADRHQINTRRAAAPFDAWPWKTRHSVLRLSLFIEWRVHMPILCSYLRQSGTDALPARVNNIVWPVHYHILQSKWELSLKRGIVKIHQ